MKTLSIAILLAFLALGACSPGGGGEGRPPEDPKFAGLDRQILAWRANIEKTSPACRDKKAGKGCRDFDVACKGELPVVAGEPARGVTARVVVAMTFNAWNSKTAEYKPGSAFAEFVKTGKTWTRTETGPVNLSTCAAS